MKPLVRWTVGNCSDDGISMLEVAVYKFIRLYGDLFDYKIFYNDLPELYKNRLQALGIELVEKDPHSLPLLPTCGPFWKLYPPRDRLNAHEIIIDNDLILYRHLKEIDRFLASDDMLLTTEAYHRNYGMFDGLIDATAININTGIIGLYPNYDFKQKVCDFMNVYSVDSWKTHFDEQGLVAYLFLKEKCVQVSKSDIEIILPDGKLKFGKCGLHLVGTNVHSPHWQHIIQLVSR